MSHLDNRQRWGLAIGGILLTLLLAERALRTEELGALCRVEFHYRCVPRVRTYPRAHRAEALGRTQQRTARRSLQNENGFGSYGHFALAYHLHVHRQLLADQSKFAAVVSQTARDCFGGNA